MNDETVEKPKCKLLAMLPKPKHSALDKSKNALIPTALTKGSKMLVPNKRKPEGLLIPDDLESSKSKVAKPEVSSAVKCLVNYGSSSEEEDGDDNCEPSVDQKIDLLGIMSSKFNVEPVVVSLSTLEPTQSDAFVGPQKPASRAYDDQVSPSTSKHISTEAVTKMIYEKELAPYGGDRMIAAEAASNIVDVNVDQALGPNVRENLLKNLNNKVMAQVAVGPLPKVKKDPKDRLSKQKHQITHLAGLAVAREEMLQEQWADNKQKKRASARRYGF